MTRKHELTRRQLGRSASLVAGLAAVPVPVRYARAFPTYSST